MRMWKVDPKLMCRQHLGGEHQECHALIGTILHGKRLSNTKYIRDGLVEVHNIYKRHDEIVKEWTSRGYKHIKPLPKVELWVEGHVDSDANLVELKRRCPECRKRIEESEKHV